MKFIVNSSASHRKILLATQQHFYGERKLKIARLERVKAPSVCVKSPLALQPISLWVSVPSSILSALIRPRKHINNQITVRRYIYIFEINLQLSLKIINEEINAALIDDAHHHHHQWWRWNYTRWEVRETTKTETKNNKIREKFFLRCR